MFKVGALTLLLTISASAGTSIPRMKSLPPVVSRHPLIVTHASTAFAKTGGIKTGLDEVVSKFRKNGLPVIYLMADDDPGDSLWLTQDRSPDLALYSRSGEHNLEIDTPEITVAGGYLELCQAQSIARAAQSFFSRHRNAHSFTVHYPMTATYSERAAYRASLNINERMVELEDFDHDPTPAEVMSRIGKTRFLDAVAANLNGLASPYQLEIHLPGLPANVVGNYHQRLILIFE